MSNNDFLCGNFVFKQMVNHRLYKNGCKSYIDHVLVPSFLSGEIENCHILPDIADYVSDHFPMKTIIKIKVNYDICKSVCIVTLDYLRINWSDKAQRDLYTD